MKTTEQQHIERKNELMEKCFECYAENGLTGTGIKALADACGCTKANLYSYFKNLDELIIESTAYCMSKVEDDFMKKAPTDPKDVSKKCLIGRPKNTAANTGLCTRYIHCPNISNMARNFLKA